MKPLRTFVYVSFGLLALAAGASIALYFIARAVLAPLPGEWSLPLHAGPLTLQAGVPSMIRLATAPWAGPLLHGRSVATRAGRIHFAWLASSQTLGLRCAPCRLQASALGADALVLPDLMLSVHRQGERLTGELATGKLRASWRGALSRDKLALQLALPMTPIADGYALFAAAIPELAHTQIEGQFALAAQLSLPGGSVTVTPRIEGFRVRGLGTEALVAARSSCNTGRRTSRLTADSWLARAVIAAEDQRFFEHAGYDLAELGAALSHNQQAGRVERGASTLSQQLAKLLVTGGERSPLRKLRELLYAVEMEETLGKQRILRLYLDHAPWGEGLCGAEAAARQYLGIRADRLSPAQAAWLAAMLHNPGLEATRWEQTGQINVTRTQRVVMGLRAMPRSQRALLADELAKLDWTRPR